jgi:hypothetical protein
VINPSAADPNGSGALGTLIQIWIPSVPIPSSTSNATAGATNSQTVTQRAGQIQTAPPAGPAQVGGAAQTQVVTQSAPSTQTATATATAQGSSAQAVAESSQDIAQDADQVQTGAGGAQTQMIEQTAGAGDLDSIQARIDAALRSALDGGWVLVRPGAGFAQSSPTGAVAGRSATRGTSSRSAAPRRHAMPNAPQLPLPQQQVPTALGAAPGGASGGSLWLFAALLTPLFLTLPLVGRPQCSSAVRRLMGFVSRLERPG